MTYVNPDLIADETSAAEGYLAALADLLTEWRASEGHVETSMAEAVGTVVATAAAVMEQRERVRYVGFGRNILRVEPIAAGVASGTVTIVASDTLGHLIPAGLELVFTDTTGVSRGLATTVDAVIAAGQTTIAGVPVSSLEAGPESNTASGAAADFQPRLSFITSVTLAAPTTGGSEAETIDAYNDRVADLAQRVRALPVTPDDHAALALNVLGVHRALAFNRRNPATPGADAPGFVTIVAAIADGTLPTTVRDAIEAYFSGLDLVLQAVVKAVAPVKVNIAVGVTVKRAPAFTVAETQAAVSSAITLAYTQSGQAYDATDPDKAPGHWRPAVADVGRYTISALIDDLPQVAVVQDVTLNGGAGPIAVAVDQLVNITSVTVTVTG